MKVISGFLPETWDFMKNLISTTLNCHSHIHDNTHFISFAFLKLHPPCFHRLAFGPPKVKGTGAPPRLTTPFSGRANMQNVYILVNGEVVSNNISLTPPLFIDRSVPNQDCERTCICILEAWTLSISIIFYWMVGAQCLTPLSIIFQLYRGGYFYSIGFWNCCDSLVLF